MNAFILTIGDELLIGQVVDTNSSWISVRLNEAGIRVHSKMTVGDDPIQIRKAIGTALDVADVVLLTGGLGPTMDDKTRDVLCDYFECGLRTDATVLAGLERYFTSRGRSLSETNRDQANVPESCTTILNHNGTAPGMWFDTDGKVLVSMPGVPFEMKAMMDEFVIPKLRSIFSLPVVVHHTIVTMGLPESHLSDLLRPWEILLPEYLSLAYLPSPGIVRLRLSCYNASPEREKRLIAEMAEAEKILSKYIYSTGDDTPEEVIGALLRSRGETLSIAESCTGGYISHLITSVPGSSIWYIGSTVSYANEVKSMFLDVDATVITEQGAVSEEVALSMAKNIREKLGTTWALATTGIAGPGGGTPEKPVGTVWIALCGPGVHFAKLHRFGDNRLRNIQMSALAAFKLLRDALASSGTN